jgi:hypothetical protein
MTGCTNQGFPLSSGHSKILFQSEQSNDLLAQLRPRLFGKK